MGEMKNLTKQSVDSSSEAEEIDKFGKVTLKWDTRHLLSIKYESLRLFYDKRTVNTS
jgi:hypothetical protein